MNRTEFERLVFEEVDRLPAPFRDRLENLEVRVTDLADAETLRSLDMDDPYQLFGLYRGIPLTERDSQWDPLYPERVDIYRLAITAACGGDLDDIRFEIGETLRHEIGHYFGLDDATLHAIEDEHYRLRGLEPPDDHDHGHHG